MRRKLQFIEIQRYSVVTEHFLQNSPTNTYQGNGNSAREISFTTAILQYPITKDSIDFTRIYTRKISRRA